MIVKPVVEWQNRFARWAGYVALWPLALLFAGFLFLRDSIRHLTKTKNKTDRSDPLVVVVGSIAVGGSGKTPVVEFISAALHARGHRVCILNHGYKKSKAGWVEVFDGQDIRATPAESGDEARMLAERMKSRRLPVPVIAADERGPAIRRMTERYRPDVIVVDDGLQDPTIQPDVTVGVLDADELKYPQVLLPLGRLRDRKTRWRRCDVRAVTKFSDDSVRITNADVLIWKPSHLVRLGDRSLQTLDNLRGLRLCAFAGIGHHRPFRRMVMEAAGNYGASDVRYLEFPDHHRYRESDVRKFLKLNDVDMFVTTHKDAVKIRELVLPDALRNRLCYLDVEVAGGGDLIRVVSERIARSVNR